MVLSFYISIGTTTDNPLKVGKSVSWLRDGLTAVEIKPTSSIDQLSPVFIIDYAADLISGGVNYVYAPFLGRYYNALVTVDTPQTIALTCNCDYLSSFDLSSCPITVTRSETAGVNIIPDTKLPIIPNVKDIDSYVLTSSFFDKTDTNSYLLAVIGDD